MMKNRKVCAIIAPSFAGQFGDKVGYRQVVAGLKALGFADVQKSLWDRHHSCIGE